MTTPAQSFPLVGFAVDHAAAVVAAASLIALGAAYGSQIWGGLEPCVLCLYQRIPYAVVIALGLAGAWLRASGHERPAAVAVALAGIAFVVGGGIAGFHVGVEQHWWQGTNECTGPAGAATLEGLEAQILATPLTLCDEVAWSLFGVSMAGYNVVASAALAAFAFFAARTRWQQ